VMPEEEITRAPMRFNKSSCPRAIEERRRLTKSNFKTCLPAAGKCQIM
jgi:hypothetical protein